MVKGNILGTGFTGLVGSRIVELFSDTYTFEHLGRSEGIDITDRQSVFNKVAQSKAEIILHLAAKTDVDGCELDKPLGEKGDAWKINVLGTQHIVEAAKKTGKKIILVSTDFVFDGEKQAGFYSEDDQASGLNWYGQTKLAAENIVKTAGLSFVIARIAYPYRAMFVGKKDFVRAIKDRLAQGTEVAVVIDHVMTPTFIDDIAYALALIIQTEAQGIYHVVGSGQLTPFDASLLIAKTFGYDSGLVGKTTRGEYFHGKAPRPFRLALANDKITKLGIRMKTFEEGLMEVKRQI